MKILFYFGHPSQYLFLRKTIWNLIEVGQSVIVLIKTKDVLEELIKSDGIPYRNILSVQRGTSKMDVFTSFIKRFFKLVPIVLKEKPSLLVGTDATLALLGRLTGVSCITTLEDDYDVIKNLARIAYPATTTILCPEICNVGKYGRKKIGYAGYMKLGYLHPNIFTPNIDKLKTYGLPEKFVLIRLARLSAHHDFGISGINEELLDEIILLTKKQGYTVFISSESPLHQKYHSYLLRVSPSDMHHVLFFASLFISDSQSMSVEAAILGTPSLRFSSFAGKISVLEELERKYMLTFGISPSSPHALLSKISELFSTEGIRETFENRREKMLNDKINVTSFLTWFLKNYPNSEEIMRNNPDYQLIFK